MEKITVLLADDHKIVRQGFRSILDAEKDIKVVGEASTGEEAIKTAINVKPAIVIMDITLPKLNGLLAARQILLKDPSIKVIILSMSAEEEIVDHAIQAGVSGYIIKEDAAEELIKAIRIVNRGGVSFSSSIMKIVVEKQRNPKKKPNGLTIREREVLHLVAEGRTNKEISTILTISIKTVEKYRQQVMDKLDIHDVANLTHYALSKGIIK
ncbi:MAG: response regulator transcription factor [Ignavibacteriales bacterium]|nr:response regulator transcription factor [Ignavibacteriales bacterium]